MQQLFKLLSAKASYLGERQAVLTRNVANADTPGYEPRNVGTFMSALKSMGMRLPSVTVAATDRQHIVPASARPSSGVATREVKPWETAPAGNGVVLEEQMEQLAATQLDHQMTSELYGKQIAMTRIAAGTN